MGVSKILGVDFIMRRRVQHVSTIQSSPELRSPLAPVSLR